MKFDCPVQKSRGQAAVEMVMTLVMFVTMIALICTICIYLYLQFSLVTAAREGARTAAVSPGLAQSTTLAAAQTTVRNRVKAFFSQATGQSLTDGDIAVTAPTGQFGLRNVSVTVDFVMNNPLRIADLLSAMGVSNTATLATIPLQASASMRFEE